MPTSGRLARTGGAMSAAPDADLLGLSWYVKGIDDKLPQ